MYPILARVGPFIIYTYTILIDIGILFALVWQYWRAPKEKAARWLDAGLAATAGALIGARLAYAFANSGYYFSHVTEILAIGDGGLGWPGAVLGGLAGAWLYCWRKHEALAPVFDTLALPIAVMSFFSWSGCLAAGCAYGAEVSPGQFPAWFTMTSADLYGLIAARWPTQPLGVAWSLVTIGIVWWAQRYRWAAGAQGAWAAAVVALGACLLSLTRGDPMPRVNGLRLDVIGGALILLAAAGTWIWLLARNRQSKIQNPKSQIPNLS